MENLKEYYELCKSIDETKFKYNQWIDDCNTVGCLWGHAIHLLPDKIFKFKKNVTTLLVSTKEYATLDQWYYDNISAVQHYFKPKTELEYDVLDCVFLGDRLYTDELGTIVQEANSDIPLNDALLRFKLALDYLDKILL